MGASRHPPVKKWRRGGIAVSYKDGIPQLPADAKVAILDFSYPRDHLLDLQTKVAGKFGGRGHKAAAGFRDPGPPEPTDVQPKQS